FHVVAGTTCTFHETSRSGRDEHHARAPRDQRWRRAEPIPPTVPRRMQYAHEPLVPPAKHLPQVDPGRGVLNRTPARNSPSLAAAHRFPLTWRGPCTEARYYRPKRRALVRPRRPLRGETSIAARPTRSGLAFYAPVPTPPSRPRSSL